MFVSYPRAAQLKKDNGRRSALSRIRCGHPFGPKKPRISHSEHPNRDVSIGVLATSRGNTPLGPRWPEAVGYGRGVPMGAQLPPAPARPRVAPTFLISAIADPLSGHLDRVQVIKGRIDAGGNTHERIFDVAWSGDRKPDSEGRVGPVGNTVDVATATYTNDIGAPELSAVWRDPDFDPSVSSFYYTRTLEIPTPRHSLYDALALQLDVEATQQPATIQERAFTSPIWYRPT